MKLAVIRNILRRLRVSTVSNLVLTSRRLSRIRLNRTDLVLASLTFWQTWLNKWAVSRLLNCPSRRSIVGRAAFSLMVVVAKSLRCVVVLKACNRLRESLLRVLHTRRVHFSYRWIRVPL